MNQSDSDTWTPEYTGGRCLCDDCCRQCPDRLIEREDIRARAAKKLRNYMKQPNNESGI